MPVSRDVHDRVEGSDRVERVSWEAELFEIAVDEGGPRHLGASEPELLLGQIHADELERPGEPGDLGAVPATEVEHTGVRGQPSREHVEEPLPRIAFDSLPPLAEPRAELVVRGLNDSLALVRYHRLLQTLITAGRGR